MSLDARYMLASFLWQQKRSGEAEKVFQDIALMGEDNPIHRSALANFYAQTGHSERAEQQYQQVIARHPDDVSAMRALAGLYLRTGRAADAERSIETALKRQPSDPQCLLIRGQLRLEQGRNDEGIQDLQRVVQADAKSAIPHYYLATGYLRQGNLPLAEAELQTALQASPGLLAAMNRDRKSVV